VHHITTHTFMQHGRVHSGVGLLTGELAWRISEYEFMASDVLRELRAIRAQLKDTADALKSGAVRSATPIRNHQALSAQNRFATREAMLKVALPDRNADRPQTLIAGMQRALNATPDVPDLRDRVYQPVLKDLKMHKDAPDGLRVLDQGQEGACTGFALAAAINLLNVQRLRQPNPPPLPAVVDSMRREPLGARLSPAPR
jgi:hypothetical protein